MSQSILDFIPENGSPLNWSKESLNEKFSLAMKESTVVKKAFEYANSLPLNPPTEGADFINVKTFPEGFDRELGALVEEVAAEESLPAKVLLFYTAKQAIGEASARLIQGRADLLFAKETGLPDEILDLLGRVFGNAKKG